MTILLFTRMMRESRRISASADEHLVIHAIQFFLQSFFVLGCIALHEVVLPTFALVVHGVDGAPDSVVGNALLIVSTPCVLEAGKPVEALFAPGRLASFLLLALRAHSVLAVVRELLEATRISEEAD